MTTLDKAGADFAKRIRRVSSAVDEGRRKTLIAGGVAGKEEHVSVLRRDSGGDLRLSGVGRRGARIGARFDLSSDAVTFKATGPVHFVANPMSPHVIPKARKGRTRVVAIPGMGVFSRVNHPGTRGKDSWKRAVRPASVAVSREFRSQYANIVRRAMR